MTEIRPEFVAPTPLSGAGGLFAEQTLDRAGRQAGWAQDFRVDFEHAETSGDGRGGFLVTHGEEGRRGIHSSAQERQEEMARIEFPAKLRPRPFYAPWKLPMTRAFLRARA